MPVVEAFSGVGDHLSAREFLSSYVHGREYVQIYAALMLKARLPDDAFRIIDSLDTLPDNTPGLEVQSPFTVRRHKIMLFTLLAQEFPESVAASRAVCQTHRLIAEAHPWAQPVLLSQLATALNALGRYDEFDSIVEQVDDPGRLLADAVEAAVRRGDLPTARRYAHHPYWTSGPAAAKDRLRVLALLAISHWEAHDPEQAQIALDQAVAIAAAPIVTHSRSQQAAVDAALGRGFDWEQLLQRDIRIGLKSLELASYWLENPSDWSEELLQATGTGLRPLAGREWAGGPQHGQPDRSLRTRAGGIGNRTT